MVASSRSRSAPSNRAGFGLSHRTVRAAKDDSHATANASSDAVRAATAHVPFVPPGGKSPDEAPKLTKAARRAAQILKTPLYTDVNDEIQLARVRAAEDHAW